MSYPVGWSNPTNSTQYQHLELRFSEGVLVTPRDLSTHAKVRMTNDLTTPWSWGERVNLAKFIPGNYFWKSLPRIFLASQSLPTCLIGFPRKMGD